MKYFFNENPVENSSYRASIELEKCKSGCIKMVGFIGSYPVFHDVVDGEERTTLIDGGKPIKKDEVLYNGGEPIKKDGVFYNPMISKWTDEDKSALSKRFRYPIDELDEIQVVFNSYIESISSRSEVAIPLNKTHEQ